MNGLQTEKKNHGKDNMQKIVSPPKQEEWVSTHINAIIIPIRRLFEFFTEANTSLPHLIKKLKKGVFSFADPELEFLHFTLK
jgi:hypothetical protein